MALQYVGGRTHTFTGAISGTVSVTLADVLSGGIGTSPEVGDLIVILYAAGSGTDRTAAMSVSTTGYTVLFSKYQGGATYNASAECYYKFATVSDDNVVLNQLGSTGSTGVVIVHVWRGAHSPAPVTAIAGPAGGSFTTSSITATNPPAITPTYSGSKILTFYAGVSTTVSLYSVSDPALNLVSAVNTSGTSDCAAAIAGYDWTSGTYDPPAASGGPSGSNGAWISYSIAIRQVSPQIIEEVPRVNNNQTFYSPSVTLASSAQDIFPARLENQSEFYAHNVVAQAVALAPERLDNEQAFYGPSVAVGSVNLAASLLANAQQFFAPTVSTSVPSQSLQAPRLDNASTVYPPSVAPGAVLLQPSLLTNTQSFYALAVGSMTIGALAATESGVDTANITGEVVSGFNLTALQAQLLYKVCQLHGLVEPLTVSTTARTAGALEQSITSTSDRTTIATTGGTTTISGDLGALVEDLAALHGLTDALVVTNTSRVSGAVIQTLAYVDGVATVTRR